MTEGLGLPEMVASRGSFRISLTPYYLTHFIHKWEEDGFLWAKSNNDLGSSCYRYGPSSSGFWGLGLSFSITGELSGPVDSWQGINKKSYAFNLGFALGSLLLSGQVSVDLERRKNVCL